MDEIYEMNENDHGDDGNDRIFNSIQNDKLRIGERETERERRGEEVKQRRL